MATTEEALVIALERISLLETQLTELYIWKMASKDILSRLIAYSAMLDGDEDKVLKDFSTGGDHISDELSDADFSDIAERMRQQKDWLVSHARSLLREER